MLKRLNSDHGPFKRSVDVRGILEEYVTPVMTVFEQGVYPAFVQNMDILGVIEPHRSPQDRLQRNYFRSPFHEVRHDFPFGYVADWLRAMYAYATARGVERVQASQQEGCPRQNEE